MGVEKNPYAFDESAVFVAPPDEGWEQPPELPAPPGWTKWLGGVGLAIGAVSGCCSLGDAAVAALAPRLMQMISAAQIDMPPVYTAPPLAFKLSLVAKVAAALLLVVAAAMCLARKPASRSLHLVWALLSIAVFIWATAMTFQMQAQVEQWMRDNPDADFTQLAQQGMAMQGQMSQLISVAINALLSLAWPVFILIWFGLIKRRPEDFAAPTRS